MSHAKRSRAHQLALRAAWKVTVPVQLLACGSRVEPPKPVRVEVPPPTSATVSLESSGAPKWERPPSPPGAGRCQAKGDGSDSERTLACCVESVSTAPAEEARAAEESVRSDPAAIACCKALVADHEAKYKANSSIGQEFSHRGVCCSMLKWQGSMTCTPWGPPTPPALAAGERARQERGMLDLRALSAERAPRIPPYLESLGEAARATWLGRMVNEHGSAAVFEALGAQLAEAGFAEAARTCAKFAEEERRHGVLCGAVVEALGGEARAPALAAEEFPEHPKFSRREAALANLLSVACLSETVAVALIGKERLEMPGGELRDLLSGIYGDEVGHARFGWQLLAATVPSLDLASRVRLGRYLAIAFAALERHELAHLPEGATPPAEGAALGLCSGAEARALFYDTVREVIIPRLESLGLSAHDAWQARAV